MMQNFHYQKEMKRVEDTMTDVTTSLIKTLAMSIYTEDEEQINQTLQGILNVEGVVEAGVKFEDETEVVPSYTFDPFAPIDF